MEEIMRRRTFMKQGIAFSMAFALGAAGIPSVGGLHAVPVCAADSAQAGQESGAAAEDGQKQDILASFDFQDGIGGWYYGKGWEYDYSAADSSVEAEDGQLKFYVDYSADQDKSWSQAAVVWEPQDGAGMNLSGACRVTMYFTYDASKMTAGSFAAKVYCDEGLDANADIDFASAQTVSGDLKKVPVTITFDALGTAASDVKKFALQLIGKETDYKGAVWFDDVQIIRQAQPDISVDSKIAVQSAEDQKVQIAGKKLVTYKKDGSRQETAIDTKISLVDKKADAAVKKVYAYLKAVGASDSVIFGHQNDISVKAGSEELTDSDTEDVTGSMAGVFGIDALSLTGNEFNVEKYNKKYNASWDNTPENIVKAAAALSNDAISRGAIVTLSAHMPNFANVEKRADYKKGEPTYAKYDFTGYTPGITTNDPMNQILPGGKYHKVYTAYLDLIADYAKQVNGAVLFRPFHENTGSWFWWGAAYCDPEIYKNVYRYTVEYLRDEKDVHNLLHEYGPSSDAQSMADYGVRYPGDAYVDLVGFDMYDISPADDGVFMGQFQKQLEIVESFAKQHNKLIAVTETGASNEGNAALLKEGNGNKDWYNQILDIVSKSEASYFLLWANWGKDEAFYTPYVDAVNEDGSLHGHEMLDHFISFYNDGRSIFAANQKEVLASGDFGKITAKKAAAGVNGYLTSPTAGQRILKQTVLQAKITGATADTKVQFILKAGKAKVKLAATADGKGYYTARLTAKQLKSLGKAVGTIALSINGKKVQSYSEIFNIKAPKEDPYLIDGFENYYGVDDQMAGAWTVQADSDCTVELSLVKDRKYKGDYGLRFTYDETATGWGGATISKEVDWSACNALQFYMIPDGKNQKTVIQINAGGVTYEAYLQEYDAYRANGSSPVLVTIPFSEFCQRDTEGNPKGGLAADSNNIQSFGLWVNAVADSDAVKDGRVSGTLYYDQITAVNSSATKAVFETVSE